MEPQSVINCVNMYERFCDDVSVDNKKHANNIQSMILLFQKNVDVREAYRQIFATDPFLDWAQTEQMRSLKLYKDTSAWITLLQYVDFVPDEINWKLFVQRHKIFSHFQSSLASARLELPQNHMVHLFLLLNTANLQALNATEMFFSVMYNRAVKAEALAFFSVWADVPFDKSDRTNAVVSLLRDFTSVKHEEFHNEIELLHNKESRLEQIFKQKHLQASNLRPKLRSKLKQRASQNNALASLDAFKTWCDVIRFPNVFSMINKKRLYFTMSQTRVDRDTYVHKFVQEHDLAATMLQYQVKLPDTDVLVDTIAQTRITSEPFAELHLFRERCFNSFSMQQTAKLRLNDLLHLYMAAYQPDCVWKAVWKSLFPVLSIQIIRDVESFVQAHPLNHHHVMHMVFADHECTPVEGPP
jgi:hypothetical protein